MMCYKDRTWCTQTSCKKKGECNAFFTEEDRDAAITWWGSPFFPLCEFVEVPSCYEKDALIEEGEYNG